MTQILFGKISQSDVDTLDIQLIANPVNAAVTNIEKQSEGSFIVTIDKAVLNSDLPPKWYVADSLGKLYTISAINQTQFVVTSYYNGIATDLILSGNEFELYA